MSVKSRLSRLQAQTGSGCNRREPEPAQTTLHERLARLQPAGRQAGSISRCPGISVQALAKQLAGEPIAEGVIRIRSRIPLCGRYGAIELAGLERHPRLPGDTPGESWRAIYLDTETTGLSGGSGTLAFLLGSAWLTDEAIELEQLLLTRFAAEANLLATFTASLTADDRLISYNGKSYDLPLLVSRYRMQALSHPLTQLPHLDLLHPVRRLFGRCWPDCRLLTLEQRLLGFSRQNDLPGAEAPAAWFEYLRHGNAHRLIRVVEHHRQDILSLTLAHSALGQAIERPVAFGVDLTALARWLSKSNPTAARQLLQAHGEDIDDGGKRLLARLARQSGNWRQAVRLWQELADKGCSDSLERLAKYHEHVSKDLAAAQRYCERLPADEQNQQRRQRIGRKLAGRQKRLFELPSNIS